MTAMCLILIRTLHSLGVWSQNSVRHVFPSLAEEEYSQLLMAFLGISRPALACLLLGLALSLGATLDERGGMTKAKCKNPKVRLYLD